MDVLFTCETCERPVIREKGRPARIWPRKCQACLEAERGERGTAPHVDVFPESLCGYQPQIEEVITGRRQMREVFARVERETGGKVRLDWH